MVDSRTKKGKTQKFVKPYNVIMPVNTHRGTSKDSSSQLEGVSNGQMIKAMDDHP